MRTVCWSDSLVTTTCGWQEGQSWSSCTFFVFPPQDDNSSASHSFLNQRKSELKIWKWKYAPHNKNEYLAMVCFHTGAVSIYQIPAQSHEAFVMTDEQQSVNWFHQDLFDRTDTFIFKGHHLIKTLSRYRVTVSKRLQKWVKEMPKPSIFSPIKSSSSVGLVVTHCLFLN